MNLRRILVFILLITAFFLPIFVRDTYVIHMAILIGIYTLGAISVNLLLGYAGQLSLGHAAFFGVGAYVSALVCLRLALPMWIGMVFAPLFAGILGYVVAKLALRLRGAYFVILTISIAEILKLVGLNWVTLTKGPMGLTDIPVAVIPLANLGTIDFGEKIPYYYLVLAAAILCTALQHRIVQSSLGRSIISIRENEDLAESVGINGYRVLVVIVVISAAITGFSGSLYAHYVSFIDPGVFSFFFSVNLVMMVIGGGKGTGSGPIVGAVLFTLIPEWLRACGDARMAVYALIVVFIVIFMPRGILYSVTSPFART
jgi:branched-chain amino acid transport system permease protein